MGLSLLHAGLAAGALLAVVPLIIHLVMRQTPKRVIFPALQLLQNRHKRSTKRLRVKNWLLLLARMALIVLMALALARPAINSRIPIGDSEVPTALGLVFDTSLSMGYTDLGKTRLDEAKELASNLLRRMPEASQVYLIDSGVPVKPVPVSPSAARRRIAALTLRPANRPLNAGVEQGYAALAESRPELPRHELYVLTDLARSSWNLGQAIETREAAERQLQNEIATYVIRVSPEDVRNTAIVAAEAVPKEDADEDQGEVWQVRATVRNLGPADRRIIEFFLNGNKRAQQQLELPADSQIEVRFDTPANLPEGLHQGELRLAGTDPLPFDDQRFVSFLVQASFDVLIVHEVDPNAPRHDIDGHFIAKALDPYGFGRPYRVKLLATSELQAGQFPDPLNTYACVFLNNISQLPEPAWNQLNAYFRQGGGIVIGLGNRTDPGHHNGQAAQTLLPGTVAEPVEPPRGASFGAIADVSHPLFSRYPRDLAADLSNIPILKYRIFNPHEERSVRVLLRYQDEAPALVERVFAGPKSGHVLVWTTPLSRRPESRDPAAWNEFPNPQAGWSFPMLMDWTVTYVAGASGTRLNYEAGEFVRLPLHSGNRAPSFVVQGPEPDLNERINPATDAPELVIESPEALGNWTVTPTGAGVDPRKSSPLGFSVNPSPAESNFALLESPDLVRLFGDENRYALADTPEQLHRERRTAMVGQELFPWLMLLILMLVTAENFLANRFHRERAAPRAKEAHIRPHGQEVASV